MAVLAGPAAALGLGQIQVKSQPGQPLLAEIPIISSDPSELQGLQVQLASPETFSRVGLEPPQGIVSSLHFEPAIDAGGRPVIRVTSPVPVQQPLLTFLLEVDWGQGRLVREYSALLDTPRTVAAPLQPPIQAPTVAPSNTIVRPPVAPAPAVATAPTTPAPASAIAPAPAPAPTAIPAPPPTVPPMYAARVAAAAATANTHANAYGPVKAGQTLGQIAAGLDDAQGYSIAQTMLALLRANPDAFIGGNINRLKQGAVLRLPVADELAHYSHSQAAALVREQMAQWRGARRPPPQPAAMAETAASSAKDVGHSTSARTTGAHLEIVPPSSAKAGGRDKAMRSGIQAGGEGDMLRQQLQESRETLAARDAEVAELKSRVAELEKLQQQQQQLITLKDSALATAQQNLAAANRKATTPVPVPAAATTHPAASVQTQAQGSGGVWLWGGIVLVFVALAGWLLSRRRQGEESRPSRGFDTAALAASIPVAARDDVDTSTDASMPPFERPNRKARETPVAKAADVPHWTSAPGQVGSAPPWHEAGAQESATVVAAPPATPAQQLELARACMAQGDDDGAKAILREVLDGRDPAARDAAARLLRDL